MSPDPKNKKLLRKLWKEPVDINKVNTDVIKDWISINLGKLLPEDDVAVEFIFELLVSAENGMPDIQSIREQLNDFIGNEESDSFCGELWELLVDAQNSPDGLPKKLVEERTRKLEEQAEVDARRNANAILSLIRSQVLVRGRIRGRNVSFGDKKSRQRYPRIGGKPGNEPGNRSEKRSNFGDKERVEKKSRIEKSQTGACAKESGPKNEKNEKTNYNRS